MQDKARKILFLFLFTILLLPLLQQSFAFITSGPLVGIFPLAENVRFSWERWSDGTYQENKSKYLNDNTGFRPDMIRFTNQVYYSLLRKINHSRIVEGADHNLFLNVYIDEYYGKNFMGYEVIHEKLSKIRSIQDTLEHMGKSFIMVHSPAKAYVYPEYFPEQLKNRAKTISNFDAFRSGGDSMGIHTVDFNTWFSALKTREQEPIWSKQGIHWSVYGSLLAADSLVRYMEQLRHIHMVHPSWTTIDHTDQPRFAENDISRILNLIYPTTSEIYSYPRVSYPTNNTQTKPKVIYIGDSFLKTWIFDEFMERTDAKWEVWYYNNAVITQTNRDGAYIGNYDWAGAISNTDIVIMMYTPDNLTELGNGFIEKAYEHYYPKK